MFDSSSLLITTNKEIPVKTTSFLFRSFVGLLLVTLAKKFGDIKEDANISYYRFLGFGACSYFRGTKYICLPVNALVTKREFPVE